MDSLSGLALFPGRWDSEAMALSSGGIKANVCGWAWLDLSHSPWGTCSPSLVRALEVWLYLPKAPCQEPIL